MEPAWAMFVFAVTLILSSVSLKVLAGNTTCASGQLDWYTSVVGETPCMTYQRLRQICNSDYQVGNFRSTTPGDQCDDQVAACCCNTIAFALSMLCMNCQEDKLDGNQVGFDAPVGTYTTYRGHCGAGTNHSLESDIQSAVCNENIRLDNFLYGGWDDGAWFYVWTRENAEKEHAANNNNTFTHCPNQISPSVTATTSSTSATPITQAPVTTSATPSTSSVPTTASSSTSSQTLNPNALQSSTSVLVFSSSTTQVVISSSSVFTNLADGGAVSSSASGSASSSVVSPESSVDSSVKKSSHTATIAGVVAAVVVLVLLVLGLMYWRSRRRRADHADDMLDYGNTFGHTYGSIREEHKPIMTAVSPRMPISTASPAPEPWVPVPQNTVASSYQSHEFTSQASRGQSTLYTSSEVSYQSHEEFDHHLDGGPVVELVRSSSGRLPPPYRAVNRNLPTPPDPPAPSSHAPSTHAPSSHASSEAISPYASEVLKPQRYPEEERLSAAYTAHM